MLGTRYLILHTTLIGEYCSAVILGCGVGALQNSSTAIFWRILQKIDLENRKKTAENGPDWSNIDENQAKLMRNTRGIRKAHSRGAKTAPGSSFSRFWVKMRKSPSEPGELTRCFSKICQILHFLQKSAKIGENPQKSAKTPYRNMHVPHPNMTTA